MQVRWWLRRRWPLRAMITTKRPPPRSPVVPARATATLRPIQTTAFKAAPVPLSNTFSGANRVALVCSPIATNSVTPRSVCTTFFRLCHRCGQPGHMIRDCPQPDSRPPRARGPTFASSADETSYCSSTDFRYALVIIQDSPCLRDSYVLCLAQWCLIFFPFRC